MPLGSLGINSFIRLFGTSESIHLFHVGKMRIKLCKGKTVIAKEYYCSAMQLCGERGGGNAAAQALYWQGKKGVSFVI
ncbi:Stomatal closure-related actin-binding protein 1 [Cardamine amara subsp. amara]|uniref:Stomatal closure-related actin-binding protein 1 n=1 Tax=Cardamine amara subsp. amara TaxID=228776 RepID=A0ABD0ZTN1_CARAN